MSDGQYKLKTFKNWLKRREISWQEIACVSYISSLFIYAGIEALKGAL